MMYNDRRNNFWGNKYTKPDFRNKKKEPVLPWATNDIAKQSSRSAINFNLLPDNGGSLNQNSMVI